MWPLMQHTEEKNIDTLTLHVYTDTGETWLYEDAGEGLDYQRSEYRWLTFRCEETSDSLTLERSVEGNFRSSYQQIELQLIGSRKEINHIEVDGQEISDWSIEDGIVHATIKPEFEIVKFKA
jgi:hypothetical protein